MLRSIGFPELIVIASIIGFVIPFWKIFPKLGFSKWIALFMIVPIVNIGILYAVAFAPSPGKQ